MRTHNERDDYTYKCRESYRPRAQSETDEDTERPASHQTCVDLHLSSSPSKTQPRFDRNVIAQRSGTNIYNNKGCHVGGTRESGV